MLAKCWACRQVLGCVRLAARTASVRWNHYKALGLTPSASVADIKAAYYKLSKIHHPDRNNGSPASAKKFLDIVAAYEVLSKTESRRQYDREMIKKFEVKTSHEYMTRKKVHKRSKKSSGAKPKVKSSTFKADYSGKSKYRHNGSNSGNYSGNCSQSGSGSGSGGSKSNRNSSNNSSSSKYKKRLSKCQGGDFETFIVRAIPLVVACLLCCKKR